MNLSTGLPTGLQQDIDVRSVWRVGGWQTKAITSLVALFAAGAPSGCVRPSDPSVFRTHDMTMSALSRLDDRPREEKLTARQLEAFLGKPERVVGVPEYCEMLEHVNMESADLFKRTVTDICGHVPAGKMNAASASAPCQIGECEVLLYHWARPDRVELGVVGGTVLFVSERRVSKEFSYVYMVSGSRVVYWNFVERSRDRSGRKDRNEVTH